MNDENFEIVLCSEHIGLIALYPRQAQIVRKNQVSALRGESPALPLQYSSCLPSLLLSQRVGGG